MRRFLMAALAVSALALFAGSASADGGNNDHHHHIPVPVATATPAPTSTPVVIQVPVQVPVVITERCSSTVPGFVAQSGVMVQFNQYGAFVGSRFDYSCVIQPTPVPAAVAVVIATPVPPVTVNVTQQNLSAPEVSRAVGVPQRTVIAPPNTGDAGLASSN